MDLGERKGKGKQTARNNNLVRRLQHGNYFSSDELCLLVLACSSACLVYGFSRICICLLAINLAERLSKQKGEILLFIVLCLSCSLVAAVQDYIKNKINLECSTVLADHTVSIAWFLW